MWHGELGVLRLLLLLLLRRLLLHIGWLRHGRPLGQLWGLQWGRLNRMGNTWALPRWIEEWRPWEAWDVIALVLVEGIHALINMHSVGLAQGGMIELRKI